MFTGLDCPGCGSQRALQALFHGHWEQAWSFNPMTLMGIPVVALYLALEAWNMRRRKGGWVVSTRQKGQSLHRLYQVLYSLPAILAWLVIILAWWIFRNL
ncbi:MAG: DUF2752 domain-containing protein [Bacteroidales bacterium]|nr:DUF2752 domain-containing protein [Bacteroidales bacterium]